MTVPQITPLPTPPQRNDPANFAARGDAFMAALPPFAAQVNMTVTYFNDHIPLLNQAIPAAESAQASKEAAGISAVQAQGAAGSALASMSTAGQHAVSAATQSAASMSAAAAANSALLALGNALANGLGMFYTNADGELIGSYNSPTVSSMAVDANGNLIITY